MSIFLGFTKLILDIFFTLLCWKMVMRTIPNLELDALVAFVRLFDPSRICSIEITLRDGTETGIVEFEDLNVTVSRVKQTVRGHTIESCLGALERLHFNQICELRLMVNSYKECYLNLIGSELKIHGAEILPLEIIQKFIKDFHVERAQITL